MGQPVRLPRSGGWLLQQAIDDTGHADLRGAYPLFCCANWNELSADLAALGDSSVAVSLVTDPFGRFDEAILHECFPDRMVRFKTHYLVDLSEPPTSFVSKHHLRNAAKAGKKLELFEAPAPLSYLDAWLQLYSKLIERHDIQGLAAFSDDSFARQFQVSGLRVFIAKENESIVGISLWMTQGNHGYYHAAAYSERGYELRASFGLFMHAFEVLAEEGVRLLSLGGVAGLSDAEAKEDGLARFKQGWSNASCDVWLCGRVLNRGTYEVLCRERNVSTLSFFPAYRA